MGFPGAWIAIPLAAIGAATWSVILPLAVIAIGVGFAVVQALRYWREMHEDVEPVTAEELMASFEQARAEGDLDDEELARVKESIREIAARPGHDHEATAGP